MNMLVSVPALAASAIQCNATTVDPVFAAIDAHRSAAKRTRETRIEQESLIALADETWGPQRISVLDMRENPAESGMHYYVDVHSFAEIEDYVSPEVYPRLWQLYADEWLTLSRRREEIIGDPDAALDAPFNDEMDAMDALVATVPTTAAGIMAMLRHVAELASEDRGIVSEEFLLSVLKTLNAGAKQAAIGAAA